MIGEALKVSGDTGIEKLISWVGDEKEHRRHLECYWKKSVWSRARYIQEGFKQIKGLIAMV